MIMIVPEIIKILIFKFRKIFFFFFLGSVIILSKLDMGKGGAIGRGGGCCKGIAGYNSSRSANPGASGISEKISCQMLSTFDSVNGVVMIPTAPEENAASCTFLILVLLLTNTILASGFISLISNAAICPLIVERFRLIKTILGFNWTKLSTALSPSE